MKWDKDIFIRNKATVNFECHLSMPQRSKIVVEKGSTLIISGTVANDCEDGWDGTIEVKSGGKLILLSSAVIKFKNNGKIKVERRLFGRGKVKIIN